ncbi:MAG: thermonuclease family protein [Nodosilinea sp.]
MSSLVQQGESQRFAEQQTEYWAVAQVEDDQTLVLTQGARIERAILCGIDAPLLDQPLGHESLDYLNQLLSDSAEGDVGVVPVARDPQDRLLAEVFVPTGGTEEIHINSQMLLDGMAYPDAAVNDCPNGRVIAGAEDQAKEAGVGVWEAKASKRQLQRAKKALK